MEQPDGLPTYATPRQDLAKHIHFAPVISSTPPVKTEIMGQDISSQLPVKSILRQTPVHCLPGKPAKGNALERVTEMSVRTLATGNAVPIPLPTSPCSQSTPKCRLPGKLAKGYTSTGVAKTHVRNPASGTAVHDKSSTLRSNSPKSTSLPSRPPISQSIIVDGFLAGHPVRILIDSGSQINMVAQHVIKCCNLPSYPTKPLPICGFNKQILQRIDRHTELPLCLPESTPVQHKFWVSPHIQADIVLGTPWLTRYEPEFHMKSLFLTFDNIAIPFQTNLLTPEIARATPLVLAIKFANIVTKECTEMYTVFVNQVLFTTPEANLPEVEALLHEYKDRFPIGEPGNEFSNLSPGLAPD
jgi:hypothetical protein